jgi:hypothetical protein
MIGQSFEDRSPRRVPERRPAVYLVSIH